MPKFPKGSPEIKEYMKSLREKRGSKPVDPNKPKKLTKRQQKLSTQVDIPVMSSSTLVLPEYFATPLANGKFKLVSPISQERNLSKRGGKTSIKLIRKPVQDMILLEGNEDPIPLSKFSKKDRTIIDNHFKIVDKYSDKPPQEVPSIYHSKPKERGRPEVLKKNIEINKQRKKTTKKQNPKQPEPVIEEQPNIQMDIQEVNKKIGRPTKYITAEEKAKKKREQTLASNKKKRAEKKALKQGTGLFSPSILTKGLLNTDLSNQGLLNQLDQTKNVVFGNEGLPTKVKTMLKKYGDEKIKSIYVIRTPVPKYITELLNVASFGEFNKKLKEADYDKLFHLAIVFRTQKGEVLLEKNESINMSETIPTGEGTEKKDINLSQDLTINGILQKTKERMGDDRFLKYDAYDNNCQNFILNILKANGLGTESDYAFVKQDTEELFKSSPHLRTLAKSVTDIAGRFTGSGMENYKIQSVIFDKKKYSIDNAKKWLRKNGYLSPKVDETENQLRFRQKDPDLLESVGFSQYRTVPLGKSGIQLIIAYYNSNMMEGKGMFTDMAVDYLQERQRQKEEEQRKTFGFSPVGDTIGRIKFGSGLTAGYLSSLSDKDFKKKIEEFTKKYMENENMYKQLRAERIKNNKDRETKYYELLAEETRLNGRQAHFLNKENEKKYKEFESIIDKKNEDLLEKQYAVMAEKDELEKEQDLLIKEENRRKNNNEKAETTNEKAKTSWL